MYYQNIIRILLGAHLQIPTSFRARVRDRMQCACLRKSARMRKKVHYNHICTDRPLMTVANDGGTSTMDRLPRPWQYNNTVIYAQYNNMYTMDISYCVLVNDTHTHTLRNKQTRVMCVATRKRRESILFGCLHNTARTVVLQQSCVTSRPPPIVTDLGLYKRQVRV